MKIDIHTHVLPKIDDGARNIEETFTIIQEAYRIGFKHIFCTSHFIESEYETSIEDREAIIRMIQKKLNEDNIDITLHCGSEIFITPNLDELLRKGIVGTLANTRYLLMELPLNTEINYLENMLYKLASMNLIPIIAHPERYTIVQKKPEVCEKMIELGALLQGNYGSLMGNYGIHAKKTLLKLLKRNQIHFLGSDVHRARSTYLQIEKILDKLEKKIGKEKVREITEKNPEKILKNEEFYKEE